MHNNFRKFHLEIYLQKICGMFFYHKYQPDEHCAVSSIYLTHPSWLKIVELEQFSCSNISHFLYDRPIWWRTFLTCLKEIASSTFTFSYGFMVFLLVIRKFLWNPDQLKIVWSHVFLLTEVLVYKILYHCLSFDSSDYTYPS